MTPAAPCGLPARYDPMRNRHYARFLSALHSRGIFPLPVDSERMYDEQHPESISGYLPDLGFRG